MRKTRVHRGQGGQSGGPRQANVNRPCGFERTASQTGVLFRAAIVDGPLCACGAASVHYPQASDRGPPGEHKTATARRPQDQTLTSPVGQRANLLERAGVPMLPFQPRQQMDSVVSPIQAERILANFVGSA